MKFLISLYQWIIIVLFLITITESEESFCCIATMAHQLSCNPVQIFGLTTENELAPALTVCIVKWCDSVQILLDTHALMVSWMKSVL